jgi:hypothetical protein
MEEHKIEKTAKITKASLLKQLKQLDRYKKEYFSFTVAKLTDVLRQIQEERTHIVEPVFEDEPEEEVYVKPVKIFKKKLPKHAEIEHVVEHNEVEEEIKPVKPVKKKAPKPVEVKEKEFVKGEKEKFVKKEKVPEEPEVVQEVESEPEYVQPNKQKFKKNLIISKAVAKVKEPILKRVLFTTDEYKKQIQKIIKDLKVDVDELLHDFDGEETLTVDDSDIIKKEYNEILDKAYNSIEEILEKNPTDLNYHKLIERKIKLVDDKVKAFLLD